MAKFEYKHNGYIYNIEADDEKSADEKFNEALTHFNNKDKTDAQATQAAKDQADVKQLEDMHNTEGTGAKLNKAVGYVARKGTEALENVPGLKTMGDYVSPSLMKGIPGVRQYVPQTEELTQKEQDYPKISTMLHVLGGTGATLPLAGGVAAKMAPELASAATAAPSAIRTFLGQLGSQGALNTGLNDLDTLAEKGKLGYKDAASNLGWGMAQGAIPAGITSVFGQAARRTTPNNVQSIMAENPFFPSGASKLKPSPHLGTTISSEIPQSAVAGMSDKAANAITSLGGGITGWQLGHTVDAALLGLATGHLGHSIMEPFEQAGKNFIRQPTTQDILRALASQGKTELTPPTTNP